jgi:hypothetical protein
MGRQGIQQQQIQPSQLNENEEKMTNNDLNRVENGSSKMAPEIQIYQTPSRHIYNSIEKT